MRRALDDQLRRTAQLRVRLKEAELTQLHNEAERMGIRFADLVRERVLTGRVVVAQTRALPIPVWQELRRIGVNLNQAVKRLHREQFVDPADVAELKATADEIARALVLGLRDEPSR